MIAIILSVAAETRVAGIVMVLQRFLVVLVFVVGVIVGVVRVDGDSNRDLHRHWDGFLHRVGLLDGHRVWAIDWELDRDGHGLLDGVWDLDAGEERYNSEFLSLVTLYKSVAVIVSSLKLFLTSRHF